MAKKSKGTRPNKATPSSSARRNQFDPETLSWFSPAAFGLLFIALIVLFNDFVFSDKMLQSSDMIQAGIFFRQFLVDHVLEFGSIPQWNPYIFGGMPYVDAFHGDIFYPLSFLKFFGTIYRSLGYVMLFHVFLAGLTMYFCARQFRLGKISALMAAICYMFSSYLISLVAPGHDGKMFVTALFPSMMLFLDRGFETDGLKSIFNFSMTGLVIGLIILTPHAQMSYNSLWALSFYAAFKLALMFLKDRSIARVARFSSLVTYAVVIGLMLSAIQFYPGFIYTTDFSPRADDGSKSGWDWATSWSLHEEEAFSQLIPEFSGTQSRTGETYYWGKNNFKDNSESVGPVAIFLALIGLFFARRRERWFFGGLALFAFVYALGATTPIFKLFYLLIPKVKSLRAPSMIMFLFSFSIALLAGMGVQRIKDGFSEFSETSRKKFSYLLWGMPSVMLLLALAFNMSGRGMLNVWSSMFYSDAPRIAVNAQQTLTKLDVAYANLPAIQSGSWFAFLFVALAAVLIWLYQSGKAGTFVLVGLLMVPLVDNIRFNKRFINLFEQSDRQWVATPLSDFLSSQPDQPRVMNFTSMSDDLLPYFKVQMVVGYHGNQLRWYDQLLGGPSKKNQMKPRFLNLVGAKYLLIPTGQQLPPNWSLGPAPVAPVRTFGPVQVIRNDNAFARVFLTDSIVVVENRTDIYPLIVDGNDDLSKITYLEKAPDLEIHPSEDSVSTDSAWIDSYGIESVLINLSITQNKMLVLTDNYYDAWQVEIDGQPAELLRTYGSFRGVAVKAGTSRVLFRYQSERYATGRMMTWLTMLYLTGIFGFYFVRRRFTGRIEQHEDD